MTRKHKRTAGRAQPSADAAVAPTPTPGPLFGPPTPPSIPAPNHLSVRLSLDGGSLVVGLPNGRECAIPCDADAGQFLRSVLLRSTGLEQLPAHKPAPAPVQWPPNLSIQFNPPSDSPWRQGKLFAGVGPRESLPMRILHEHTKGGLIAVVDAEWSPNNGRAFHITTKWIAGAGQGAIRSAKRPQLTLEDLGL